MKPKTSKMTVTPMSGASNTITSLPPAPVDERRGRMIRYSVSMGVRLVCIIVAFLVPGWWALVPAIGAIVLPYVAVVLANAGHDGPAGEVERPGGIELYRPEVYTPGSAQAGSSWQGPQDPGWSPTSEPTAASESGSYRYEPYAPGAAPRRARPSSADTVQPPERGAQPSEQAAGGDASGTDR